MVIRGVGLLAAGLLLAGCNQTTGVWVRTDGQRITGNAVLEQQGMIDRTICEGEMSKANMSGVTFHGGGLAGVAASIERGQNAQSVAAGCMAQRGYVKVPQEQADQTLMTFAANAKKPAPTQSARR